MATVLDGKAIAERIKAELLVQLEPRKNLSLLQTVRTAPQLRVLFFDTPASQVYWHAQRRLAEQLGIATRGVGQTVADARNGCVQFHQQVTQGEVESVIDVWNRDARVHGIFVHQPLPEQLNAQSISAAIDPRKDVEGIHPQNSARRFFAKARIGSCTALAVMALIEEAMRQLRWPSLEGKEAVVVGHSEIVGRPVSMLLLDKLATTTICHIGTDRAGRLEAHVRRADVLVVAVGKPDTIKGAWIKPGAIVIDVGINVKNKQVVGDVEFEAAKERAGAISPVPGGVGPVTVMMVMKNTVEAYRLQRRGAA